MNPEEIYNSIKKTSAEIQNLSKLDAHFDDIRKKEDSTSQDSGIQVCQVNNVNSDCSKSILEQFLENNV